MGVVTKRSSMAIFSDGNDQYSHRVRIVLAEKGVVAEIVDCDKSNPHPEVAEYNPYNEVPTLVDRDLALYETAVIMEYLDERFPHPPLLPVYPVARAQRRLLLQRIERDWASKADRILAGKEDGAVLGQLRKELEDSLISVSAVFEEKPYFMSDEFSLVDCYVAPLLWRLPMMGIQLPVKHAEGLLQYANRLFDRESFRTSLSKQERAMR